MMHCLDLKKKLYLYQSSIVIHYKVVTIINKQISLYCMIIFFNKKIKTKKNVLRGRFIHTIVSVIRTCIIAHLFRSSNSM